VRNTHSLRGAGLGLDGAMVQMISHGLISAALFLCVGVLYDRIHSRQIADYGGVVNTMPVFASFMVLFALANTGLPGTSGFVGEFLVILASFNASFWYSALAAVTLVLGAAYTLWLVKRVIFGPVTSPRVAALEDLNGREFVVLSALALAVLVVGVWPAPLLKVMQPTIHHDLPHPARRCVRGRTRSPGHPDADAARSRGGGRTHGALRPRHGARPAVRGHVRGR